MILSDKQNKYIDTKLSALNKSKFRSSFHLRNYMLDYIDNKGFNVIESHARDFVVKNISAPFPKNDGRQTPMKGHPVFIAQHACACCCRSCLEKWHKIPKGRELTTNEIDYIVALLIRWIEDEYINRKNER